MKAVRKLFQKKRKIIVCFTSLRKVRIAFKTFDT